MPRDSSIQIPSGWLRLILTVRSDCFARDNRPREAHGRILHLHRRRALLHGDPGARPPREPREIRLLIGTQPRRLRPQRRVLRHQRLNIVPLRRDVARVRRVLDAQPRELRFAVGGLVALGPERGF